MRNYEFSKLYVEGSTLTVMFDDQTEIVIKNYRPEFLNYYINHFIVENESAKPKEIHEPLVRAQA